MLVVVDSILQQRVLLVDLWTFALPKFTLYGFPFALAEARTGGEFTPMRLSFVAKLDEETILWKAQRVNRELGAVSWVHSTKAIEFI